MYGSGRPQRGVPEGEAHESLDIGRDDVVDHERILGERYHANQGRHSLATSRGLEACLWLVQRVNTWVSYQPRLRHLARCGRSVPSVVSSP
jgi:hypothetical protein